MKIAQIHRLPGLPNRVSQCSKIRKMYNFIYNNHYLIRASMVLVNFFGNNIDDVPGGFEIFT